VVYQRAGNITERATSPHFHIYQLQHTISQRLSMESQSGEARIVLAIDAIGKSKKIRCNAATKFYKIPRSIL
jgi:hypothetical protein